MARKVRFERAGGLYHVLNRGNYRSWVFESEGAKRSFEKTLAEACQRSGWIVHAYVVMGNHYHLALETPEPNLGEGMRWLQSVFATRFNRYRGESGHLFQGRYKSIVVEDWERLGWLCHYINLNPVRAGICSAAGLRGYGFGSYRHLWSKRTRPGHLCFEACLEAAGGLRDAPAGWRGYARYLEWLAEDEPRAKAMLFDRMSKGWALGSSGFRQALLDDEKALKACLELGVDEAGEMRDSVWTAEFEHCLEILGKGEADVRADSKSADWKIATAAWIKESRLCRNGWLAERLRMGPASSVGRYVSEFQRGGRPAAKACYEQLKSRRAS